MIRKTKKWNKGSTRHLRTHHWTKKSGLDLSRDIIEFAAKLWKIGDLIQAEIFLWNLPP